MKFGSILQKFFIAKTFGFYKILYLFVFCTARIPHEYCIFLATWPKSKQSLETDL